MNILFMYFFEYFLMYFKLNSISLLIILQLIFLIISLLIIVAFYTLLERKILAIIQRRKGPNVVGIWGLLQPLADGLKLLAKGLIIPSKADHIIFMVGPLISFAAALFQWIVLPLNNYLAITNINTAMIYTLAISSIAVYGLIMAGWSSNSKYSLLGALRAISQMISYELVLSFIVLSIILITGSFDYFDVIIQQRSFAYYFFLAPLSIIFIIVMLAETNRTPFDLSESESEVVSGYHTEYAGLSFALFFLGEYANMFFMSSLITILFTGGFLVFNKINYFLFIFKILIFVLLFVLIRGTLPRFRYDQLMMLGWKHLLPFVLGFFFFLINWVILANCFYFDNINFQNFSLFFNSNILAFFYSTAFINCCLNDLNNFDIIEIDNYLYFIENYYLECNEEDIGESIFYIIANYYLEEDIGEYIQNYDSFSAEIQREIQREIEIDDQAQQLNLLQDFWSNDPEFIFDDIFDMFEEKKTEEVSSIRNDIKNKNGFKLSFFFFLNFIEICQIIFLFFYFGLKFSRNYCRYLYHKYFFFFIFFFEKKIILSKFIDIKFFKIFQYNYLLFFLLFFFFKSLLSKWIDYIIFSNTIIQIYFNNIIIKQLVFFLKFSTNLQINSLIDIIAVDWLYLKKFINQKQKYRFTIIYNLLSTFYNIRINLFCFANEKTLLNSLTALYFNANWAEREIWDLFGLFFKNHTNLRRILTDYGYKLHPLKKDHPLTGFLEINYNDLSKSIEFRKVSFLQKFRDNTNIVNPWKITIFCLLLNFNLMYPFLRYKKKYTSWQIKNYENKQIVLKFNLKSIQGLSIPKLIKLLKNSCPQAVFSIYKIPVNLITKSNANLKTKNLLFKNSHFSYNIILFSLLNFQNFTLFSTIINNFMFTSKIQLYFLEISPKLVFDCARWNYFSRNILLLLFNYTYLYYAFLSKNFKLMFIT